MRSLEAQSYHGGPYAAPHDTSQCPSARAGSSPARQTTSTDESLEFYRCPAQQKWQFWCYKLSVVWGPWNFMTRTWYCFNYHGCSDLCHGCGAAHWMLGIIPAIAKGPTIEAAGDKGSAMACKTCKMTSAVQQIWDAVALQLELFLVGMSTKTMVLIYQIMMINSVC